MRGTCVGKSDLQMPLCGGAKTC
uniref:Uncharacterized protein n=1 Tax=Ciona savignyi TaxID=51511 RepID=H2YJ81_CIOSA